MSNPRASSAPPSEQRLGDGAAIVGCALLGFVAGQILGLVALSAAKSFAHFHGTLGALSQLSSPPWWYTASSLVGLWAGFLLAVLVAQQRFGVLQNGVFRSSWRDGQYVVLGVVAQLLIDAVYAPFHVGGLNKPENKIFGGASGLTFALLCVMTALLAPIVEELFFRGVLLRGLRSLFAGLASPWAVVVAIVSDGVLFALAHGEWVQFPGLAVVGIILATIYVRTRRIIPCMLTHASFNGLAVVVLISQRLSHS